MPKKKQIHVTSVDRFPFCGEQWRRRFIDGDIIPPGIAMIVGSGTDKSVTKNLQNKIDNKVLLTIEEVEDIAKDAVTNAMEAGFSLDDNEAEDGVKATKGKAIDKAVRLSVLHAEMVAPGISPTEVQRSFALDLDGYPYQLAGTMDIQEGPVRIRDTKTTGKTPSGNPAEVSSQMAAYSMATKALDGKAVENVSLDYLVDLKTPKAVTYDSTMKSEDHQIFIRRLESMISAIEKGVFLPARQGDYMCSPKYCGYYNTCKYTRNPVTVSV